MQNIRCYDKILFSTTKSYSDSAKTLMIFLNKNSWKNLWDVCPHI